MRITAADDYQTRSYLCTPLLLEHNPMLRVVLTRAYTPKLALDEYENGQ